MKKILCICLLAASMAGASAQSQEARENRAKAQRQRITPEMVAQNKTDKMSEALSLTKKQSKKLYKINLQDAQDRQQSMRPKRQRGERPQGERPQGHRPRPEGFGPQGGRPERPQREGMRATLSPEELKERAENREKEIQKILGEEKYAQWQKIAAEEKAKKEAERPRTPESTPTKPGTAQPLPIEKE